MAPWCRLTCRPSSRVRPLVSTVSRSMAVYAVGEGWTGALTREYALETIPGHYDTDDDSYSLFTGAGENMNPTTKLLPVCVYPFDDVEQVAVGWGCTALLTTQGDVKVVGRPHDLVSLLRMNRMPKRIRQWAVAADDPSDATFIGTAISKLVGWASGGEEQNEWTTAKQFSLLHDWTSLALNDENNPSVVDQQQIVGDRAMSQLSCSAGFMAMIGRSGTLYTLGYNSRGQCGIGKLSNNVWTPQPVRGLSLAEKSRKEEQAVSQDVAMVQVELGFQHGVALDQLGQVYSWGKGSRGQLGREIANADQDATARLLPMEDYRVTQIASGHHHGALVTDQNLAYIWGKNMSRVALQETEKPGDARTPEAVVGLPADKQIVRVSCGSHHTSFLLDDGSVYAVGIASDEAVPLLEAVELIPAGMLEMPLKQFEAHFDRTTVVDRDGQVALQVHLWRDEKLREHAFFTPMFVEALLEEGHIIESIHRGWLHSVVVTAD